MSDRTSFTIFEVTFGPHPPPIPVTPSPYVIVRYGASPFVWSAPTCLLLDAPRPGLSPTVRRSVFFEVFNLHNPFLTWGGGAQFNFVGGQRGPVRLCFYFFFLTCHPPPAFYFSRRAFSYRRMFIGYLCLPFLLLHAPLGLGQGNSSGFQVAPPQPIFDQGIPGLTCTATQRGPALPFSLSLALGRRRCIRLVVLLFSRARMKRIVHHFSLVFFGWSPRVFLVQGFGNPPHGALQRYFPPHGCHATPPPRWMKSWEL